MDFSLVEKMTSSISFKDVAGYEKEKQELEEIKDFLINPDKYSKMGARAPKGIILTGDPGVGKTLVTKAIAGEARVPIFQLTAAAASEEHSFAEAVKLIFEKAREAAPAIIFIDEIHRLTGRFNFSFEDNHKMLNQLLVEMDGFGNNTGVVVVATANDKRQIEHSLLRSGRFDRHVHFELPSLEYREAILKIHAHNKPLAKDVSISQLAKITSGLSGADLENLLNEAALLAIRNKKEVIENTHLEEAMDRVVFSGIRKNKLGTPEQRYRMAIHEAGHALIAMLLKPGSVEKISLKAINNVGGFVHINAPNEVYRTKDEVLDRICNIYGGRAAEEIILGQVSTLAQDDLRRAQNAASAMVIESGLIDITLVRGEAEQIYETPLPDSKIELIDKAVSDILYAQYNRALNFIKVNLAFIKTIASELLKYDVLAKAEIEKLLLTYNLKLN